MPDDLVMTTQPTANMAVYDPRMPQLPARRHPTTVFIFGALVGIIGLAFLPSIFGWLLLAVAAAQFYVGKLGVDTNRSLDRIAAQRRQQ